MTRTVINLPHLQSGTHTPVAGKDSIQLHADAHNSVALAAYYLARGNGQAARRKLVQAMSALRAIDLVEV